MMSSTSKQIRDLLKEAERQGWTVDERRKGYLLKSPDGVTMVSLHKTPSDHRWLQNTLREMRKGGFEWKG